jgi:superfamily II DNA/RNA helicase
MGSGFKANAIYGGRTGQKDKIDLKHRPAILIGTPGRIADRFRRDELSSKFIKYLVLDEFDKSLEIGFEVDMKEIIDFLPNIEKRVLTSATKLADIPRFVGLTDSTYIDYSDANTSDLSIHSILSPDKDKLETLLDLLDHIGNEPGIIFCNFKDSIQTLSDFLTNRGIKHGCFYGGMEQKDRERVLIKFRNGTQQLLVATDLAARGLDIPELSFIIHYELPFRNEEFIHRNGRTARMTAKGNAYVILWEKEKVPEYISNLNILAKKGEELEQATVNETKKWTTLFISGGRKDKISKGDIAGLFFKQGGLAMDELGSIELKQDCAFVAVDDSKADQLIIDLDNSRLKKKKVRIKRV